MDLLKAITSNGRDKILSDSPFLEGAKQMTNKIPDRRKGLKMLIEDSKLSIPQIARKAEINQQTLYNYLAGRSDMTISFYDRIVANIKD